jgi:hypothetical protein
MPPVLLSRPSLPLSEVLQRLRSSCQDQGFQLDEEGLITIYAKEFFCLSWHSQQLQIPSPYFDHQHLAKVPFLQLASMLRRVSAFDMVKIQKSNRREDHMSMELDLNIRLFEMLDKKVVWRQNGKEYRGTFSAFDPSEESFLGKMTWKASIQGPQPRQYRVLLSQIADGSVEIELDVEETSSFGWLRKWLRNWLWKQL